jgi:hypothetical protein
MTFMSTDEANKKPEESTSQHQTYEEATPSRHVEGSGKSRK